MNNDLFSETSDLHQPLAARLRPQHISEYVGQQHVVGDGKPLRLALEKGQLHSMILRSEERRVGKEGGSGGEACRMGNNPRCKSNCRLSCDVEATCRDGRAWRGENWV